MIKTSLKIFLAFFVLPIAWLLSLRSKTVQHLEDQTMFLRYLIRGDLNETKISEKTGIPPLNIFYVNIDADALKMMGEEPIPLSYCAKAMYALQKNSQVKAITTDVFFGEKKYSTLVDSNKVRIDEQLCTHYFSKLSRGITGGWFNCTGNSKQSYLINEYPLPLIKDGFLNFKHIKAPILPPKNIIGDNIKVGIINPSISTDLMQNTRWLPLYARTQQGIFYGLSIETLRSALNPNCLLDIYGDDSENEVYQGEHAILFLNSDVSVIKKVPLKYRQLLEINWFSSWKTSQNKKISIVQLLKNFDILEGDKIDSRKGKEALDFFKQFDNSIVFLSNTFSDSMKIKTLIDTDNVPKITAHVNAFKTMYWGNYIKHFSIYVDFLIIFVLNFFIASLTLYNEIFSKYTRLFISCIVVYFLLAFYLFGVFSPTVHIALPIAAPLGSIFTFWGIGTLYQLIVERHQRLRLKRVFGNYLSPELVSTMLKQQKDPQLGGVERNLTAFFSDIQSFSTFSELLSPEALVRLMNEYLTEVTNVIIEEGGTLDKYIGDAVVAMFGAPFKLQNHPLKACMAACKIQDKQALLRERWQRKRKQWPQEVFNMRTRIGLCSGNAIVGNMGSNSRFNFTMMGDTVNIGARCESGAKTYGVYTLVSEDTYKEVLTVPNPLVFRFIDRIVVKGRQHPLGIYELVGLKQNLKQNTFDCLELFEQGIHNYLSRNWSQAIQYFEKSAALETFIPGRDVGISTNPSLAFINRCQYMMNNVPDKNWDGIFVMKTK